MKPLRLIVRRYLRIWSTLYLSRSTNRVLTYYIHPLLVYEADVTLRISLVEAKKLNVVAYLSTSGGSMNVADVARETAVSMSTARAILLTLCAEGKADCTRTSNGMLCVAKGEKDVKKN